jgi:hypothetical protein
VLLFFESHHVARLFVFPSLPSYIRLASGMTRRVQGEDGLRRLVSQQRKLKTNKVRQPWRHRTKRTYLRKTPAEKAALAAKRLGHRQSYQTALAKARAVVMDEAIKLKEQFGAHSVDWYFEAIMQQSRISKTKRAPSRWNAYLRQEVKAANNGMQIYS